MNTQAINFEKPSLTFLVRRRVTIMLVSIICVALLLFVRQYQPGPVAPFDAAHLAGIALVVIGLIIRSWAAGILQKGLVLATEGPYSACRHPLYAGSTLMLIGFCLLLGDLITAIILLSAWAITYPATVGQEEGRLALHFRESWTAYAATTPRLFPPRLPRGLGTVSVQAWMHNHEYRALITCVLAVAAVEVWRTMG